MAEETGPVLVSVLARISQQTVAFEHLARIEVRTPPRAHQRRGAGKLGQNFPHRTESTSIISQTLPAAPTATPIIYVIPNPMKSISQLEFWIK